MTTTKYSFENGQFLIEDKELKIDLKDSWTPQILPQRKVRGTKSTQGHFLEIFAENATPYAYGWIIDKELDGEYLLVYSNGNIKGKQYYKTGKLHGPSTFYTNKGSLLSEGWFFNGLQEGRSNWYYFDGVIYSRQIHQNGQWHGQQLFYYHDGKLKSDLNYNNGKLHGKTYLYYPDGSIEREFDYNNGELIKANITPPKGHPRHLIP